MNTSNPAMIRFQQLEKAGWYTETMSIQGTVVKTAILLLLVFLSAGYTWTLFHKTGQVSAVTPWMWGGILGGLVMAFATVFKPTWAPITAPLYALLEGLFIGGISSTLDAAYPGIVIQAVGLTFGTCAVMLSIYMTGWIQVTDKFRMGIVAATGAIALVYLATIVLGFFGISIPYIHQGGVVGILFSLFVVGIAAFNLILDFDLIEKGAKAGAPKYMEWYGAFALMVTLVWLYIEILRLLSKIRDR